MAKQYTLSENAARVIAARLSGGNIKPPGRSVYRDPDPVVLVKNSTSETIPPYSVLALDGVEMSGGSKPVYIVKKHDDSAYEGEFLFSWHYEIEADKVGLAQGTRSVRATFSDGTGAGWYSPEVDSWELKEGGNYLYGSGQIETSGELLGVVAGGGGAALERFKITEDLYQCDEADAQLIDTECNLLEEIRVIDLCGYAELAFDAEGEAYAPENSMGHCQYLDTVDVSVPDPENPEGPPITVQRRRFEVVNIAVGCCDEFEPPCPEIPGVPAEIIPILTDEKPDYLIGYKWNEDLGRYCLVRVPVSECPDPCTP